MVIAGSCGGVGEQAGSDASVNVRMKIDLHGERTPLTGSMVRFAVTAES
jgi:hypothetical protein